ncbi:nucleotidyltransferase family protein [Halorubrum ezzemoulense]|uniref:nucleotidyltransferase domain-containing protein n=1 Tax=Halorubrum ezzemoulense TaxID=337243 RepID=UPI00232D8097|nr:nucleotidyltransferase family protein [Halorubrum ezzemoulense]MDB2262059.1 nucleotidyltransferase family protein [Halorubrum ezzemoulense]MDB2268906.1 nucleotidyltransferase family protein [Halorubrum ezzemoulense]
MPTTPEADFVFNLVRQIGNPDQAEERLREIAHTDPDWSDVLTLAGGHGIVPLLNESISGIEELVPREYAQTVQSRCRSRALENIRYVERLHDLNDAFRENQIRVIPYKGPVVAEVAYGSISCRWFSDLDFLVIEEDPLDAHGVLQDQGYKQTEFAGIPPSKLVNGSIFQWEGEFHFLNERDEIPIDLRHQFVGKYRNAEGLFSDLWERRTSVSLAGESVPALSPEDRVVLLLAHGTKHGWCRLSWVCDVALLLQQDIQWNDIIDRAAQYGWKTAVLLGIAVAAELAEIDVPRSVRRQISADPRANIGSAILCALFSADPTGDRLDLDPLTIILLLNNTPRDSLREAFNKAVSPWPSDYQWISLPQKLYPLYYLVRPIRILLHKIKK